MPASSLSKQTEATTTTTTPGTEAVRLETTSLERGLNHRRVLFDDDSARCAFPSRSVVRAGLHRPAADWAAAAVRIAWNAIAGSQGRATDNQGEQVEVRG
jgi:hypothetical protein